MASTSRDKSVRNTRKPEKKLGVLNISVEETNLIKNEFNEKLYEHFLSTKNKDTFLTISDLKSTECITSMIQKIRKEEKKANLDKNYVNIYRDKYKIVQYADGKGSLFYKDDDMKLKMVLPWEELFDVYWEAHVKYAHDEGKALKKILNRDVVVNDFAVQTLSEVCYTCSGPKKPYYCCSLDLVTMGGSDYAFSHLMVCQDMYSGYIHLRPICADNKDGEICVELFRIFMDFGPPKKVLVSDAVFLTALDQIKHLTTYAPISIEIMKVSVDLNKINSLRKKIRSWMATNNFGNWGIACYGFQFHLNKEGRDGHKSPYDRVFKKLQSSVVEDLTEEENDSSAISMPSDATLVDKAVSTRSPIDFNAMNFISGTGQSSSDSDSSDEIQEIVGGSNAIETEIHTASEDETVQCEESILCEETLSESEEEDPLAIY